jgi:ABC-type transport system involved in multi-copper enzyme maturation permease subunit
MIPVLRKELRTRMRGWRTPILMVLYLGLLAAVCYAALAGNLNAQSFNANQATFVGLNLFNTLAILQGLLIVFITPAATSGAISGERQRQTLDLLLVTRVSSLGITSGKLLAAIAFDLLLIVSALPIFSLVFLFSGIGLDRILELVLLFIVSIMCFGSIGILVSTLTRKSTASTVVTYVLVLLIVAGLAFLSLYLSQAGYAGDFSGSSAPFPAYLDPGLGLAALLYSQDASFGVQLPFSIWQTSILSCIAISAVCLALSTSLVRRQRA